MKIAKALLKTLMTIGPHRTLELTGAMGDLRARSEGVTLTMPAESVLIPWHAVETCWIDETPAK